MKIVSENVGYRVGAATLVEGVSVSLPAGRTCVLLGPNGAGKSTFLRLLAGYLSPTTGNIAIDDMPLAGYSLELRAKLLGVLTQRNTLDFPFRVHEVVEMGASAGSSARTVSQQVMGLLGLDAGRIYTELSGGERQLVQLGRVIAQVWQSSDKAFLLLDEPMTALDLKHQQMVASVLARLKSKGTGQLIVMHDINMAAEIADQIILMSRGQIVASGPADEVLNAENLEVTFDTPMTVIGDGARRYFRAGLSEHAG